MWELLAVEAGILAGSYIYHRWIEDQPPAPKPPALTLPRTDEGSAISLLYGRVRVRTPILAWAGNYLVLGQVYTGGFGSTTANHYSVDLLFILGLPFFGGTATFLGVSVGDTPLSMSIGASSGTTQQYKGGPGWSHTSSTELSINGVFYQGKSIQDVTNGTPSNSPDTGTYVDGVNYGGATSFARVLGFAGIDTTLVPGFRSQVAVFGHIALGTTADMPSLAYEIRTLSTGSVSDLGNSLADDADPAAVILDVLTGGFGKLGISKSLIDITSFQNASLVLFNENNGYSRVYDQSTDAVQIIADVLRHIDGVIYQDPVTGLITLRLVRASDLDDINDDVNPDNATTPSESWYSVQGWSELPNYLQLSYTDRANGYQNKTVVAQNPAGIAANGGRLRKVSLSFPGCCTSTLAQQLAAREMAAVSRPIVKATVKVTRTFHGKRPGDVVTLTWPELSISKMPMRIARVNRGRPGASAITLDMIRDVSSATVGAFPVT